MEDMLTAAWLWMSFLIVMPVMQYSDSSFIATVILIPAVISSDSVIYLFLLSR